jgi:hypothetical protein
MTRVRDPRLVAVAVVVFLAVAISWAAVSEPAKGRTASAASSTVPITNAAMVCPQAGGTPSGGAARIGYAAVGTDPYDLATSSASTAPLDPDGVSAPLEIKAGHAWVIDGPKTVGPVQVNVDGPLATNLGATQFTRQTIGTSWQVSTSPCEGPTTHAWFVGFSTGVGAHATLLLSNVDDVAATVNVGIYGDSSPPNTDAEHGLTVAPRTQLAVRLDTVAPGLSNAAAEVTATAGRDVPALRFDAQNGSIPLGVDFVPRASGAALSQTVPGIPGGEGSRRVVIAAPGEVDATVSVKLVTADGSYTPTGLDVVDVPAGGVVSVDLDKELKGAAAGVVVTSTEPVVAGAVATLKPDKAGGTDVAFTSGVPPLSGPAIAPDGETSADRHTQLLLTAPDEDAHLQLTLVPSAADAGPVVSPLTVPGGTTLVLDLRSLSSDVAPGVALSPQGGGPLFAAWVLQETSKTTADLTALSLWGRQTSLSRPGVSANLMAGLPGRTALASPPASAPASDLGPGPASEPAQIPSDFPSDFPSELPSGPASSEPLQSPSGLPSSQPSP